MKITTITCASAALCLAFGLTACSSGDSGQSQDGAAPAPSTAAGGDASGQAEDGSGDESSQEESDTGFDFTPPPLLSGLPSIDVGPLPSFSGTVNGEDWSLRGSLVTCVDDAGQTKISALGSSSGTAVVIVSDDGQVDSLAVTLSDGRALTYAQNVGIGHAQATVSDSTYTITGEATVADASNTEVGVQPFDIEVTCM